MFEGLFRPMHLLLILVIVLIIFGPGKLPEIGEGLGKSIRGFKKAMSGKDDPLEEKKSSELKDEKKS
jgi:sec-independent protein translocase protein TatA